MRALYSVFALSLLVGCAVDERPRDITLASPLVAPKATAPVSLEQVNPATEQPAEPALSSKTVATQNVPRVATKEPVQVKAPQYRIVNVVRTKPGCKGGACPSITLKRLSFNGYDRFNAFLETSLVNMAQIDSNQSKAFNDLAELSADFWKKAESRNEIVLGASVKRATPEIVVIVLESYLFSGGAHGISTMQYVNWLPKLDRIVTLEAMLLPGQLNAFEAVLKSQHAKWLETNEFAKADKTAYEKMWPFQFSDNAALLENGIAVTFDPYTLGPYVLGMPTIFVPFAELKGIVNNNLIARISTP